MNDYFDQFERSMGTALARGAQAPWYSRAGRIGRGRTLALVFGALVLGTPAGAVTNCFGACVPAHRSGLSVSADRPALAGQPFVARAGRSQTPRTALSDRRRFTPGADQGR